MKNTLALAISAENPIEEFHGVATDFDGVVSHHSRADIAEKMLPVLVERSLGKGVPLAIITGKELADAQREIIEPIRRQIAQLRLNVAPQEAMVYANNGSVVYDMATEKIIERRIFNFSLLEAISDLPGIRHLLELYEHIDNIRGRVNGQLTNTHFRQMDNSTICLRIDPDDLNHGDIDPILASRLKIFSGKNRPTRFDIAKALRAQFAAAGFEGIQISSTDRSIDITPAGSGKRNSLEDFAKRNNLAPDDFLRFGDSPTGMDYGLLAAFPGEKRSGFSNVSLQPDELQALSAIPEFAGTEFPRVIEEAGDQFEKVEAFLQQARMVPKKRA